MPLYEVTDKGLKSQAVAKFADLGMYERADLQRLLRDDISALDEDLLVIAEEFGGWEDARRRIDLLALDKAGRARRDRAEANRGRRPHGAPGHPLRRYGLLDGLRRGRPSVRGPLRQAPVRRGHRPSNRSPAVPRHWGG